MKKTSMAGSAALLLLVLSASTAFASTHHHHVVRSIGHKSPPSSVTLLSKSDSQFLSLASWGQKKPAGKKPPVNATTTPQTPPITPKPVTPVPTPTPAPTPAAGEVRLIAYTTGYGYPDNTPAGNDISNPVIHSGAGGTGTFSDPLTLAVGHTITGNKDILDYPEGTKVYIPTLRKYFIVEDTCGDGNSPQSGPCHTGYQGHVWLDLWVGGTSATKSATLNCEDDITDLHAAIINPASNYAVVQGAVFNGSCAQQYGDTAVTQ